MLEGLRRQLSHRRGEKEKARLKDIEVERRLSYIKMKRLQERRGAEEELRTQKVAEITTLAETREALAERRRAEKELRRMTPGLGRRVARVAKGAFYDVPVKTARALSKPGAGEKMRRIIVGDTSLILGTKKPSQPVRRKPEQSTEEFLYGKPGGKDDILS